MRSSPRGRAIGCGLGVGGSCPRRRRPPLRQLHDRRQVGVGVGRRGERHARATKCSWKRGSMAVSILDDRAGDAGDLGAGRGGQQGPHRARARGVADRAHPVGRAVGDEAEHERVERVDVAAERAGEPDRVDVVQRCQPGVVHQQPHAGVQRGLGELDRAHVVLGDAQLGSTVARLVQHVGEVRPSATTRGVRAASAPSMVPSASSTPARNSSATTSMIPEPHTPVMPAGGRCSANPGSSDQRSTPITGCGARACRGRCAPARWRPASPAARTRSARLRTRGRSGSTRRAATAAVAEHDLGVRADVDEEHAPRRRGAVPRASTAAAVSAPTWPAMQGRTWSGRGGSASADVVGPRVDRPSVASAKAPSRAASGRCRARGGA